MPDNLTSAKAIMTMASAVANYCVYHKLRGEDHFEQVARRVIKLYESGVTEVDAILTELDRIDRN